MAESDFDNAAPIGVFDSGVGGLSVLRALREQLPNEHFVYVADSACAPYGERGAAFVAERSVRIAAHLRQNHAVRAVVIACNTATAAAAAAIRAQWPAMPVVGVEPAIKPAAAATRTGIVAVMATRGTVESARFANLIHNFGAGHSWRVRACDGLAAAIEAGDEAAMAALVAEHAAALTPFGAGPGCADTLVLGCTHYVFAIDHLRRAVGQDVQILDTAGAVARQTARVLGGETGNVETGDVGTGDVERAASFAPSALSVRPRPKSTFELVGLKRPPDAPALTLLATSRAQALSAAAQRWLSGPVPAAQEVAL